ncbi:hypothetical protein CAUPRSCDRAFT_12088 [Caulochytrium protostelioides]|uniref:Uncharacterized protein n=1 Tax=Caulochytrium protostelioides TaxID=1555241 RepID=A0A4V1IT89_9FUNG|nr:hypothetical protein CAUPRSCDRAFT_12088 [Caulochytrium protostelioides]
MRWSFDRARAPLLLLAVLLAAGAAHGVFDESGHGESASRSSLEFQAPTYNWFLAASPTVETQKASTTQRSTKWYNDFKTPQSDDILVAGMDALRFKVTLTSGSGKAQLDKLFEPLELARRLFPVATAKFVSATAFTSF